jgi:hypothetical protein
MGTGRLKEFIITVLEIILIALITVTLLSLLDIIISYFHDLTVSKLYHNEISSNEIIIRLVFVIFEIFLLYFITQIRTKTR